MEKKAFVLGHLGMGDQFFIVGIVRYLRIKYDEVVVVCKKNTENNVKNIYSDDPSIKIISVTHDSQISPAYGFNKQRFNNLFKDYKIYTMGFHKHGVRATYGAGKQLYDLPFSFYDDINIPYQVFWDYFHINEPLDSLQLYNAIADNKISNYIFIHNSSSSGEVFSLDYITKRFHINKHKTLIVNPCKNIYKTCDKYYETANKFLDKPLLDYISLIKNADKVIMSDSSFLSLSIHLEIKTNDCFIFCRKGPSYNYNYDHFWSDKYKPTSDKFKKFTQIN